MDDAEAKLIGMWKASVFARPYVGAGYIHDDRTGKGEKSATFTPKLPKTGEYEVLISYTTGGSRSTNTPVAIAFDGGEKTISVDQTKPPEIDRLFHSLGKFQFQAGMAGSVTISNRGTDGHVIVDAVRFVPVGDRPKLPLKEMGMPAEVNKAVADAEARLQNLETTEAALKKDVPPPPRMVMAVRDQKAIADARINIRGNPVSTGRCRAARLSERRDNDQADAALQPERAEGTGGMDRLGLEPAHSRGSPSTGSGCTSLGRGSSAPWTTSARRGNGRPIPNFSMPSRHSS